MNSFIAYSKDLDIEISIKKGEIMIIKNALIMNIMMTENGLNITKEMVENSLESFINVPVVYNSRGDFKDYTEKNIDNYKTETFPIGVVLNGVHIENDGVYAEIMIWDKYEKLWHGKYDNWCIVLAEDKKSFRVDSIEVF